MLEVSYLGVPIKIYSFTGRVVDSSKQLETKVSGSGGDGAVYQGSGAVTPINIQSSTTVHDQFFLIDENGKEICVKLQNWDISLRTQHNIQVIWAVSGKANQGPYVTINNQNLNDVMWNDSQLKSVISPCLAKHLLIGIVISIILGYITSSFSLFLLVAIATFIYFFIRREIFSKDLKNKIQEYLL